jgi:phage terminase large subunit-like protein
MQDKSIAGEFADTLADGGWRTKARPEQLPPPGDWNGWVVCAGRGFGKTRTGAEWVRELVETGAAGRVALIAPTAADCRDVIVEGPAGILAVSSPWCRPEYQPALRRLTWPNGATASTFSAEEADRLRGPQHDAAWFDELAAFSNPSEVWDMAMFGLRLGTRPKFLVTTTPRPVRLLRELLAREGHDVVITRGSTLRQCSKPRAVVPGIDPVEIRRHKVRQAGAECRTASGRSWRALDPRHVGSGQWLVVAAGYAACCRRR